MTHGTGSPAPSSAVLLVGQLVFQKVFPVRKLRAAVSAGGKAPCEKCEKID